MTVHKRWQDSELFVQALLRREYLGKDAAGNLRKLMPEGVYLYMWELWKDALELCECCEHGRESGCCFRCSMPEPAAV